MCDNSEAQSYVGICDFKKKSTLMCLYLFMCPPSVLGQSENSTQQYSKFLD